MFVELKYFSLLSIFCFRGVEVPKSCPVRDKVARRTVELTTS
jgi:hypothetical protein